MEISSMFDKGNIREIGRVVRLHGIDIVNAQSSRDRYTSIFAKWMYQLPCKVVHTRRTMPKSMKILGKFYQNGTDKIVAVSEGVKYALMAMGISDDHIQIIRNGTPPEKYADIDQQQVEKLKDHYKLSDGDIVIGSVGRMKEQHQILRALSYLKRPVKVIFVGIESQPNHESIIEQYTLPHQVYYTGIIDIARVLSYYSIFTMHILASAGEGLPQVLLESMALGIPSIATNVGGIPELIQHQHNGLLYNNGDIKMLARLIESLIDDANLIEKLQNNARKTALENFSIEKTIDQYETFFAALLQEKE